MSFTYDPTTAIGIVRLLIPDRKLDNYIFEDEELQAFINAELNSHPKRAAALALETLAADEAYVQKAIRILDLSTDGPATARILLQRAQSLRTQAEQEEAAQDGGAFDWAEQVSGDFSFRERMYNEFLRSLSQ